MPTKPTTSARRILMTITGFTIAILLATLLAAAYMTIFSHGAGDRDMTSSTPEEKELARRLRAHVAHLAETVGNRNMHVPGSLELSAAYIVNSLQGSGYTPTLLPCEADGLEVYNIEATLTGSGGDGSNDGLIIIGAHYDTVPGTKGANDNASGVAAVLELAQMMKDSAPEREVRFVLFVNEEPPYFKTDQMGSYQYASGLKDNNEKVTAMLSIETIGYYTDEPDSQSYPFPLNLFYPSTGNFIAFVGNLNSRPLVKKSLSIFFEAVDFRAEGAAVPGFLPGVDWSDHWGFWQMGYPAIMVTDTAPYRYGPYHTYYDTPEKLNYERMARVVMGLRSVILRLSAD